MEIFIFILAFLGFFISIYATYVKFKHKNNKSYRAMCDFRDNISCTKALSSKYGKLIGMNNRIVGILFFSLILILNIFNSTKIIVYLSMLIFIVTLYLAYLSYFKLKNFCLVCTAIYIINFLLLIFSYTSWLGEIFS